MEKPWAEDYIDLATRFLEPDEAERLYTQHPSIPRNAKGGCTTCGGDREFVWQGQRVECHCEYQLQLAKHYTNANIGELYQRLSWDDYEYDSGALKAATGYLKNHRPMTQNGIGLMYLGDFETGKTMLVSLMGKEMIRLGYDVYFCTFAQMIEMFTKGWGNNIERSHFESRIVMSQVLVLDDIGKEFRANNNLAESTFDHILRQRVIGLRPTLITTNMDEDELDDGYGGAIFSLLKERSVMHTMPPPGEGETGWRERARDRALHEAQQGWRRPIF